jgi:hypothetical protein
MNMDGNRQLAVEIVVKNLSTDQCPEQSEEITGA